MEAFCFIDSGTDNTDIFPYSLLPELPERHTHTLRTHILPPSDLFCRDWTGQQQCTSHYGVYM